MKKTILDIYKKKKDLLKELNYIYRAEVIDNIDPKELGRLKVKLFSLHEGINNDALPWAIPNFSYGGQNDVGLIFIPEIGDHVVVSYIEGYPVTWIGTCHSAPGGTSEIPKIFRGDATDPACVDTETLIDQAGSYNAVYPQNKGIRTKSGIVIELDDTSGCERVHVYHPSGSHQEFRANGDVVLHVKGDYHIVVDGDVQEYYKQLHNQQVDGNQTKTILGSRVETITLDKTLTVLQNMTTNVTLFVTENFLSNLIQNITGNKIITILGTLTTTVTLTVIETYLNLFIKTVTLLSTYNFLGGKAENITGIGTSTATGTYTITGDPLEFNP